MSAPRGESGLLAKSPRGGRRLTLEQHLADTEQAASALFRAGTRWATTFLRFFRLEPHMHSRFLLNLRIAALFHDVGKANADFQRAVTSARFVSQSLRHEHLSALLLADPGVDRWLAANLQIDRDVVLAAVLSHHIKAGEDGKWQVLQPASAAPTQLLFGGADVRNTLRRVATLAALKEFDGHFPDEYDHDGWHSAWDALWRRAPLFRKELRGNSERQGLALAVKAGVIIADSVASGLYRTECEIGAWIDEVAHRSQLAIDQIDADVLQPRAAEISRARGKPFVYQRFQEGAETIGRRGLLLAACGAGKTLAAWRWAAAVARTEPIGRVIFLYPTRGTATEGFRDYVGHAPEGSAALVHGSSRYELLGMSTNAEETPESLRGKKFIPDETEERLFALGLWPKRYFSATVDQFLSFMEHGYGGLCLLPALADAAVVFDEVHSYDRRMWNALVAFLTRFDVPVLCMTATLPPSRKGELGRLLRVYPGAEDAEILRDLERAEACPRYRLREMTEEEAFEAVIAEARHGKRILWVVNTVRRCQRTAARLRERLGIDVLVYHSRFKLEHRQRRHRATVDAFRVVSTGTAKPVIALTTQVCEMSLDLDADVLVSEHAPVSSLVQRFGRAHRHLREDPTFRADLLTYPPEGALPYERADLEASRAFLSSLANRDISQQDLAVGIEHYAPPGRDASGSSRFIDGGFFATPGNLREDDGSSTAAILDVDLAQYIELARRREPTDGLQLNVPQKYARPPEENVLPSWLSLADGARYSTWLGFVGDDEAVVGASAQ